MKVKDLIAHLQTYDPELEVIYKLHSDYDMLDSCDIQVVEAVCKNHYYMRSHPTMSEENKSKALKYLCFPGN